MRELFVDSRDRVPGGTSTNFTIQLREQLVVGPENSFRIDYLRVPLVIPRIQLGINDKLYFTVSGTRTPRRWRRETTAGLSWPPSCRPPSESRLLV